MNELASGDGWRLYKEDGQYVLELRSIYGKVCVGFKGTGSWMAEDILATYEDLKAQGPVVVESQVE